LKLFVELLERQKKKVLLICNSHQLTREMSQNTEPIWAHPLHSFVYQIRFTRCIECCLCMWR